MDQNKQTNHKEFEDMIFCLKELIDFDILLYFFLISSFISTHWSADNGSYFISSLLYMRHCIKNLKCCCYFFSFMNDSKYVLLLLSFAKDTTEKERGYASL